MTGQECRAKRPWTWIHAPVDSLVLILLSFLILCVYVPIFSYNRRFLVLTPCYESFNVVCIPSHEGINRAICGRHRWATSQGYDFTRANSTSFCSQPCKVRWHWKCERAITNSHLNLVHEFEVKCSWMLSEVNFRNDFSATNWVQYPSQLCQRLTYVYTVK